MKEYLDKKSFIYTLFIVIYILPFIIVVLFATFQYISEKTIIETKYIVASLADFTYENLIYIFIYSLFLLIPIIYTRYKNIQVRAVYLYVALAKLKIATMTLAALIGYKLIYTKMIEIYYFKVLLGLSTFVFLFITMEIISDLKIKLIQQMKG